MIAVESLTVQAGSFSLAGVSFEVPTGLYGVLMGATASGKTTILETVCGLRRAAAGRIIVDGRDITRLRPAERGIGYVPQDGALFDTMTVREHLAFSLVVRRWPRRAVEERVDELARLLGVDHLLDRGPAGLSGGESQRVALGRALAARPSVLCLDEPLSSLDEDARGEMRRLLKSVCREAGVTTLHVTHQRSEAVELGERIFRIDDGTIRDISDSASRRSG